jgi:hypothetical protein
VPSPAALDALRACTGLRWIVVHAPDARAAALEHAAGVRLRARFASGRPGREDLLYEVAPAADRSCERRLAAPSGPRASAPAAAPVGRLAVDGPAPAGAGGSDERVVVAVENREAHDWRREALSAWERVGVRVRWLDARGTEVDREDIPLPVDVAAGASARFEAWVRRPRAIGTYRLELALVRGERPGTATSRPVTVR